MKRGKSLYVYPLTPESLKEEKNSYVRQLLSYLGGYFNIVNGSTKLGLLDAFKKFWKTELYYFNWIENLPTNRFGRLQVGLLAALLVFCKLFNKKVVWFVHNNISHDKTHRRFKKIIVRLMAYFSDLVLSHSGEITLRIPKHKLHVFHHPIETFQPLRAAETYSYDMLIWGSVLPYKGVAEFVEHVATSPELKNHRILIAGEFKFAEYYDRVMRSKSDNVLVMNKFIAEEDLICLFAQSKYILFTYASDSVLSSAALCKSLSYGKDIIAPNVGSFKELGSEKFLFTYTSFSELETLLKELKTGSRPQIDKTALYRYIENTNWPAFASFVGEHTNNLYIKSAAGHARYASKLS